MGHALNKTLKDLVVKSRSMAGFDAPYVVGYDCHGLPIELKVDKELGPKKRDMIGGRVLPGLPRVRPAVRGEHDRAVPAPRRPRHLGSAVPDDGFPLPGGDRPNVRTVCREGPRLQRQEAGALVHSLPHRAGRGRGRVRAPHVAVDLRRVSARAGKRGRAGVARAGARRPRRLGADLDDDTLDRFRRIWRSRFIRSSTTPRTTSTAAP